MNQNIFLAIIVVVIATMIGVYYYAPDNGWESSFVAEQVNVEGKTIIDLFNGSIGSDVYCEFSYNLSDTEKVIGMIYKAGDKISINSTVEGGKNEEQNFYVISDGENGYAWSSEVVDGNMHGTKFATKDSQESIVNNNEYLNHEIPINKCQTWEPAYHYFNPPQNVNFIDANAINLEDGCTICNLLEGIQKEECQQRESNCN